MLKSPDLQEASPDYILGPDQGFELNWKLNPQYALSALLLDFATTGLKISGNNSDGFDADLRIGAQALSRNISKLKNISGLPFGHYQKTYTPELMCKYLDRIALGELHIELPPNAQSPEIENNPTARWVTSAQELALLHIIDATSDHTPLVKPNGEPVEENLMENIRQRMGQLYDILDRPKTLFEDLGLPQPHKPVKDYYPNWTEPANNAEMKPENHNQKLFDVWTEKLADHIRIVETHRSDITPPDATTLAGKFSNHQGIKVLNLDGTEVAYVLEDKKNIPTLEIRSGYDAITVSPATRYPKERQNAPIESHLLALARDRAAIIAAVKSTNSAYRLKAEWAARPLLKFIKEQVAYLLARPHVKLNPSNLQSLVMKKRSLRKYLPLIATSGLALAYLTSCAQGQDHIPVPTPYGMPAETSDPADVEPLDPAEYDYEKEVTLQRPRAMFTIDLSKLNDLEKAPIYLPEHRDDDTEETYNNRIYEFIGKYFDPVGGHNQPGWLEGEFLDIIGRVRKTNATEFSNRTVEVYAANFTTNNSLFLIINYPYQDPEKRKGLLDYSVMEITADNLTPELFGPITDNARRRELNTLIQLSLDPHLRSNVLNPKIFVQYFKERFEEHPRSLIKYYEDTRYFDEKDGSEFDDFYLYWQEKAPVLSTKMSQPIAEMLNGKSIADNTDIYEITRLQSGPRVEVSRIAVGPGQELYALVRVESVMFDIDLDGMKEAFWSQYALIRQHLDTIPGAEKVWIPLEWIMIPDNDDSRIISGLNDLFRYLANGQPTGETYVSSPRGQGLHHKHKPFKQVQIF